MNDACFRATLSPLGGIALWQAAEAQLREVFGVTFDYWACCDEWQPLLQRNEAFGAAPPHARLVQGAALCEWVAATGRAQYCDGDDARVLLGVPLAEHGHLHLVALGEFDAAAPDALLHAAAAFDDRWAAREARGRQRDAAWQRAMLAARSH